MSIKAYRKLSFDKLEEKISTLKKELAQTRLDLKSGRDKDYSQIGKKKKEIARLMTVMTEKLFLSAIEENKDEVEAEIVEEPVKKETQKVSKLKSGKKDEKEG